MSLWLIGGFDPTGGAGVLRDYATAHGVAPSLPVRCAVTAWTRQGHGSPAEARAVAPEVLDAQIRGFTPPRAIKIGLVPSMLVDRLIEHLKRAGAPIVLDPILRASDGGALGSTPESLSRLCEQATLVTPNLAEGSALAGYPGDADGLLDALVRRLPGVGFLLKGGHGSDVNYVTDRLWWSGRARLLTRPRRPGPDPRGTGCALATAIACGLASGCALDRAVLEAVQWLDEARTRAVERDGCVYLPVG